MAGRSRLPQAAAIAIGLLAMLYFFPLFRIVPLQQTVQKSDQSTFAVSTFVERFWTEKLLPGADHAIPAVDLLAAFQTDRKSAREKFGRKFGMSDVHYYLVSGNGRVVSVDKSTIGISIRSDSDGIDIRLPTGNIFGNAVRDGTGMIDINDIPNSQDFNAVSSEINALIEKSVLPQLREKAKLGVRVRFVGCAEIIDEENDLKPLQLVPFIAEVETP